MIHFTCDACHRPIRPDEETRYVVRVEVYAALDDDADGVADESDHLDEIEDLLERMEGADPADAEQRLYTQVRHDLCEECRERFLRNPLGKAGGARIGFSKN